MTCKHLMRDPKDCVFCHRDQLQRELEAAHRAQRQAEAETGRALAAHAIEVRQLRGNLSLAEEGLANYQQKVEQLRDFLSAFQELLGLDPENHPGTDLGRLMLEVTEHLRPPPQPGEQG